MPHLHLSLQAATTDPEAHEAPALRADAVASAGRPASSGPTSSPALISSLASRPRLRPCSLNSLALVDDAD